MRKNNGISLIVLVITIIVIIILAGSVILSLSNNNPIAQATEATFKANIDAYNSALSMSMASKYVANSAFNPDTFNAKTWDGVSATTGTIKEAIPSITDADAKKFEIQNGKLVYVGDTVLEQSYMTNMGLTNKSTVAIGTIATKNATINGSFSAYNNPIIPEGFKALNTTDASWSNISTDWNKGLVIQDASGNEFVWVPVDGTNVKYEKWCTIGHVTYAVTTMDTLPAGVTSEISQVEKYGGFYIARYEAGKEGASTLVSKKSASTWNNITYPDSKLKSEQMYNTASVKSGLATAAQYDTTLRWIDNSGKSVSDSKTWGNYPDSASPANVAGFGALQVTGFSENWKAKNIYDIAGNSWEWINEIYNTTSRILRGGDYHLGSASVYPASSRHLESTSRIGVCITFRVALFVI